jgi:hypothetical protein
MLLRPSDPYNNESVVNKAARRSCGVESGKNGECADKKEDR